MSEEFDNTYEYEEGEGSSRPSNRPFVVTMSVLGLILILGLAVMAVWVWGQARDLPGGALALFDMISNNTDDEAPPETVDVDTSTLTPTPTLMPTATLSPAELVGGEEAGGEAPSDEKAPQDDEAATQTREDAPAAESTPAVPASALADEARTATVAALLTAAAESQDTPEATATELPDTGFVDEVGLPVLGGLALLLLGVIILVRRLRVLSGG